MLVNPVTFRVLHIAAEDGLFPQIMSMINYKFLTPMPSIIGKVSLLPNLKGMYINNMEEWQQRLH